MGTFSDLSIYKNSSSIPVTSMLETHFSGLSNQLNYSNLSIFKSGNLYIVENGYSNNSVYINGSASSSAEYSISYNLSFSYPVKANFQLHGYSGTVKWEVNGTGISGATYDFNVSGFYNVSAYENTGTLLNQGSKFLSSREVFIPAVLRSVINVTSNISYDMTPQVSLTLNRLYSFSLDGKAGIPVLPGSDTISAKSPGFIEMNETLVGGKDYNFTMSALPVHMNVFVNPGFVNVTANNVSFTEVNGIFTFSTYPREIFLNVSAAGYKPTSDKVKLMPGKTYSGSVYLTPLHAIQKITGRVTDRIFKYGLYGVMVSSNSSNYVFTNATGYYVFYNTNETKNLTFSRSEYNSTTDKVDSSANETINVQLIPLKVTASALFSVSLGRYFPFLFSLAYLSWSTNAESSSLFSSYQIIYADNALMNNPSYLNISNPGTQSTVLAGIFPGKTYYVTINMYLSNGQIITGNTITISYTNLIDLVMNLVILAGVGIYAYVAVGFIIRRRNRKKYI
jgi:subtilase family serine protease